VYPRCIEMKSDRPVTGRAGPLCEFVAFLKEGPRLKEGPGSYRASSK